MNVTNIDQSRKLLEFGIDPSTADCLWVYDHTEKRYFPHFKGFYGNIVSSDNDVPAWSLAALLNYLREIDFFPDIEADEHSVIMSINYYDENEGKILCPVHNIKVEADNFIDAVFEMVCRLKFVYKIL